MQLVEVSYKFALRDIESLDEFKEFLDQINEYTFKDIEVIDLHHTITNTKTLNYPDPTNQEEIGEWMKEAEKVVNEHDERLTIQTCKNKHKYLAQSPEYPCPICEMAKNEILIEKLRQSEKDLSNAYLKIQKIVGTISVTNFSSKERFEKTEKVIQELIQKNITEKIEE